MKEWEVIRQENARGYEKNRGAQEGEKIFAEWEKIMMEF